MDGELTVSVSGQEQKPLPWKSRLKRWITSGQAYLYLLPAFVILGVFSYTPTIFVFVISLFKWNFLRHTAQPFAGLGNYEVLFRDPNFWQSLQVTVLYVVFSVPIQLFLSLFLAIMLMSGIRAKAFWRLAIFAPYIMPMVATTTIWLWMFDNYHGLFNGVLKWFHLQPIDWLGDPHWILPSIILYTTWKSLGFNVVLFMAGLTNVSAELSEAAKVDGANIWQVFRHITWPMLKPVTVVVLLLSTIEAFKMFQPVFLLVGPNGGAGNAGRTLGLYLFSKAFGTTAQAGMGSAISVVIFLLVFTISVAQFALNRRDAVD
ncbi:multiple sugar transport system permease protein [Thermosporothrix hazakensis]|uniref:Multiple sugar transport system permease protein n=2 Tax=Thermosporothrix TaxID=768650 RepID=A0A326UR87_THEHA|nr:sugar ABC transporter permease [Thermosporothrix hazakensis]PZW32957.1 multiple sugar transport system permease protein [Thermosporothrix hazakensis]BBH90939.1 sugar ABC transporter permease [Thermosporothrix sp. COM3]GCE48989.1 sugar ABC transporter permease [Thermosporothrix hazakensis]